jgi:ABC-type nitrate/sulfonate/bicarbonate transport system substrate-binding protein
MNWKGQLAVNTHDHNENGIEPQRSISRRALLGGLAAGGAAVALGAVSGPASAATRIARSDLTSKKALTKLSYQLGWIPNAEFAGTWIALNKGYYTKAGLNVNVIPGGPTTAPIAVIESGTALVTIADPIVTATAVKQGADLRIIGTQYQRSPYCLTSLASKPIRTPKDMIGRKIGLAASDEPVWHAFLKLNKILPSQVPTVPIQFDPSVLVAGECEGIVAFSYEQSSELAQKGVKSYSFLWDDYGFKIMWNTYIVTAASLKNAAKRAALVEFLYGEALGWTEQVRHPQEGATLAVKKYGASLKLNLQEQTREAVGAKALIVTQATKNDGLFAMPAPAVNNAVSLLKVLGLSMPKSTFDTSLLNEMHKQHPALAKLTL